LGEINNIIYIKRGITSYLVSGILGLVPSEYLKFDERTSQHLGRCVGTGWNTEGGT
jgi:hypothetical protein